MSDPQGPKKKNKKKKKSSSVANSALPPPIPVPLTEICQNGSEKDTFSINEVLPQKVGMKTVFKDVEVTMTHSGSVNEVVNGTSKKKKKKKKSKQVPTETAQEATSIETDNKNNFFKFNEDHIELVNHPEISVTFSKQRESSQTSGKVTSVPEQKQLPEVASASTDTQKKKRNRKKKKKSPESTLPTEPTPESVDPSYTAPTYVKLPASGDSCVLLVSHESFSNDNKPLVNNTEKETNNNSKTILVQSKERVEELKVISASNSKSQSEASVSIFPVASESNKMLPEKNTEIDIDSSLQKMNNLREEVKEAGSALTHSEQEVTPNSEGTTLTKAQLKAERRAKQEAQRAAKLAKSGDNDPSVTQGQANTLQTVKPIASIKTTVSENAELITNKCTSKSSAEKEIPRNIFSHLPQYKDLKQFSNKNANIHPAILEIGSYYSKGILFGSNARCVGFLAAFRDVIKDHKTPSNKEFARDLESKLQVSLNFLNSCRPLSVSILNSVRFLKHQINHLPRDMAEEKAKEDLCLTINNFVKEEILLAKEAICISATAKIVDGDTIMVFAYSSLVKDVLCKAHDQNKSFQVVVVESRPKMEGSEMVRRLLKHGLKCSFIPTSAASSAMKMVSKVIIGAHALLSNGNVMSRVGSMKIAEMAESCSVPVLVCCETYKFCERALTDSFVHNELGNAEDLTQISLNRNDCLKSWNSLPSLQIHNVLYDVTSSDLISVVITEKGLLPCTSVPVVLRVKQAGLQE